MQQLYKYNKADYDLKGFKKDGKLFSDTVGEWEIEFNKEFKPHCANYLLGNYSTIKLLSSCFNSIESSVFGMDGQFDLKTNLKNDESSEKEVIYAIGQTLDEDEQLFIVMDNEVSDGIVILKYRSDDDETKDPIEPVNTRSKVKVLKK